MNIILERQGQELKQSTLKGKMERVPSLSTSPLQLPYEASVWDNFLDVYSIVFLFSVGDNRSTQSFSHHKPTEV